MAERRMGSAADRLDAIERAYAYRTQGSAALQPEWAAPERGRQRPQQTQALPAPSVSPSAKALPKPFALGGILTVALAAVVLSTILLAQMGQITAAQKRIDAYNRQISDAGVVEQTLLTHLARTYNVAQLEQIAITELGMQYPKAEQYRSVELPSPSATQVPETQPQAQEGFLQWVLGFLD